jgi:putative transposase
MARKLRLEDPGPMHHVMSRGDQRDDIFLDDEDHYGFLKTLSEPCKKTERQIHAFWTFLRSDPVDGIWLREEGTTEE